MSKKLQKILSIVLAAVLIVFGMPVVSGAAGSEYNGLYYEVMEDGNIRITGYDEATLPENLVIPSAIDGRKVTEIGDSAFEYCNSLTNVTIPDSVTKIGIWAFAGCDGLTNIVIPKNVTSLEGHTFENCSNLKSVTIKGATKFYRAFLDCENLTSVTLENGVTSISDYAFQNCKSLKNIIIPESVISIGRKAFDGCSLTSINIPKNVTYIEYSAFDNCINLTNITVNPENGYYSSDSFGVLFDKDKTVLIQYPIGNTRHSYTIPDGVEEIGDTFSGCDSLVSIIIPNGVTSISGYAFAGCSKLKYVTIPDSITGIYEGAFEFCGCLIDVTIPKNVTWIGDWAFDGCDNLKNVTILSRVTSIGYDAFGPSTATIYGYAGSTAQTWAEEHNRTFKLITEEEHKHTPVEYTQPSTCKVAGYTITTCSDCGDQLDYKVLPLAAHTWGEWKITKEATFFETGLQERSCSVCGETEKSVIPVIPSETKENEKTGISVTYDEDSFDGDIEVEVKEDFTGSQYLGQSYGKFTSWNIKISQDGKEVQPSKPVYVRIPMPKGFNRNMIAVYHINTATGKPERMDITIDGDYICFYATSFSPYVIVDESTAQTEPEPTDPSANCSCNCHKSGFMGFIWKIINFFNKLFRSKQYCACGAKHW